MNPFLIFVLILDFKGYVYYNSYKNSYSQRGIMKTVQMTLEENLVSAVDKAARQLGTSRSGFARYALRDALKKLKTKELEGKHRAGYMRHPVQRGEFDGWESEHAWGDE